MEAAFFDLDKTVIDRASIMAFAPLFRREGLLSRRSLLKGALLQLAYRRWGASPGRIERVRRAVLSQTRGWERNRVRRVVAEALFEVIQPITYAEARELIVQHRNNGRRVYLVSAAPAEIVEPVAGYLGADGAVASVARTDPAGLYTGELERYVYGQAKADAVRSIAEAEGIDLCSSFAYGDSISDLPMLEAVGHPVAVNPDRRLRKAATEQGWEVTRFSRRGQPIAGTEILPDLHAGNARREPPSRRHWAGWGTIAAALAAAGGGATAIAWRSYRSQPRHA